MKKNVIMTLSSLLILGIFLFTLAFNQVPYEKEDKVYDCYKPELIIIKGGIAELKGVNFAGHLVPTPKQVICGE